MLVRYVTWQPSVALRPLPARRAGLSRSSVCIISTGCIVTSAMSLGRATFWKSLRFTCGRSVAGQCRPRKESTPGAVHSPTTSPCMSSWNLYTITRSKPTSAAVSSAMTCASLSSPPSHRLRRSAAATTRRWQLVTPVDRAAVGSTSSTRPSSVRCTIPDTGGMPGRATLGLTGKGLSSSTSTSSRAARAARSCATVSPERMSSALAPSASCTAVPTKPMELLEHATTLRPSPASTRHAPWHCTSPGLLMSAVYRSMLASTSFVSLAFCDCSW
mmetsp:Transcript_27395/g.93504  ORF Transcript_27395/g.93504 Transcript_27395/m.93504 type:complete len:273 (+) Transcript_27395:5611-6429(+)